MKLAGKIFLTLLSVAGLLGLFWLSLPWLVVSIATQQLEVRGFTDVEFGRLNIGMYDAELESLRLSSNSMDIAARWLAVDYELPRLLSARLASISIENLELTAKNSTSSSAAPPDVAWIAALLTTPWYNYLPADQITVHHAIITDEESSRSTHAGLELTRTDNTLRATVNLIDSNKKTHKLIASLSPAGKLDLQIHGQDESSVSPLILSADPGHQPGHINSRYSADLKGLGTILPFMPKDMHGQLDGELILVDEASSQTSATLFRLKAQLKTAAINSYAVSRIELETTGSVAATDEYVSLLFDKESTGIANQVSLDELTIEEAEFTLPAELKITDKDITILGNQGTVAKLNRIRHGDKTITKASLSDPQFTISQSPDTDTPSVKGSLSLDISELRKKDVVVTASPIDIQLQMHNLSGSPVMLDATTDSVIVDTTETNAAFHQCSVQLQLPDNRVTADMLCNLVYPQVPVNAHLDYRLNTDIGVVTFNTGKAMPNSEQPLFVTALKNWDEPYDLVSGSVVANGKYRWKSDDESLTVNLWAEDAGGFYEDVLFSGLEYEAQLELLPEIRTLKPSTLKIDIVDIGIPVTDIRALIELKPTSHGTLPMAITNNLQMNLLAGKVTGDDIKYDLNSERNQFDLEISGLDLSAVVAMQQVEGLQATGLMDGRIPVHINKDGLAVTNGALHARPPGGRIQYSPVGGTQDMEQAAPGTNIVFEILEDLNYHTLETGVSYTPDGDLTLNLAIKGRSPKLDKKRPVHFNLNLEQNVLQLLRSLRIAEDIDSVLDKNVQDYFKSRH